MRCLVNFIKVLKIQNDSQSCGPVISVRKIITVPSWTILEQILPLTCQSNHDLTLLWVFMTNITASREMLYIIGLVVNYRNWPLLRSALSWLVQQSGTARVVPAVARPLAAAPAGRTRPAGTTSAVPDCSTDHDSADRRSGQFLFYHDHNFTKSKGNLRFRRLVPLFVPIGVCITTHCDGTASDVTIGMWRHNQQATNQERNGKPWFSLPK